MNPTLATATYVAALVFFVLSSLAMLGLDVAIFD